MKAIPAIALAMNLAALGAARAEIIISEIMFNPSYASDTYSEWIEVYNASGSSVNLDGLVVDDDDGSSGTVESSAVIAAGGYALLGCRDASSWGYVDSSGVDVITPDGFYGSSPGFSNSSADEVFVANTAGTIDTAALYDTSISSGHSFQLTPF